MRLLIITLLIYAHLAISGSTAGESHNDSAEFELTEQMLTHLESLPWCNLVVASDTAGTLKLFKEDGTFLYDIPRRAIAPVKSTFPAQPFSSGKTEILDCEDFLEKPKPRIHVLQSFGSKASFPHGFTVGYSDGSFSVFHFSQSHWQEEFNSSIQNPAITAIAPFPQGLCLANAAGGYRLRGIHSHELGSFGEIHDKSITAFLYNPRHQVMFSASESLTLKMWRFEGRMRPLVELASYGGKSGVILPRGSFHHDFITAMVFLRDNILATGPQSGSIRLWSFDDKSLGLIRKLPNKHKDKVKKLLAAATEVANVSALFSLDNNGSLYLWRLTMMGDHDIRFDEANSKNLADKIIDMTLVDDDKTLLLLKMDGSFERHSIFATSQ